MAKQTIFIFLLCSCTLLSRAQLIGGLKGGLNANNIIVTNSQDFFAEADFTARYSFHAGSFVRHSFSVHFAWQVEMLFANKGVTIENSDLSEKISLNYLNWPLLIVYTPNKKFGIEAGLEPGFLISSEPRFNSFDLGMDVGISYLIKQKWLTGIRYSQGFPFSMNPVDNITEEDMPNYQHSILQLYLGFNLIKEN